MYAFGNVGGRETEGDFFFRNPNSRGGVYTSDFGGTSYRAIVDTNIRRGDQNVVSNCPALASPGSGGSGPLNPALVAADALALAALPANCFVMNQLVPGGYTPRFGGILEDAGIVGGLRGEFQNGMMYDFSASYGRNAVEFYLANTWNPSNGPDGIVNGELQRAFNLGSYIQSETNFNADFVLPIKVDGLASDLNFAFGAEYRDEVFSVLLGEERGWNAGRFAFNSGVGTNCYGDGVTCQTNGAGNPIPLADLSIGAHGFAGFSPPQAGRWARSNIAVYGEVEADLVDNFTAALAVRYEDFEDFGDTTNGKLALRWALTDDFAMRGSVSTGFRAPTPGQSNITKVSTITVDGELQQRGQIPPTNQIAQFLGAEELKPEKATNISAGVVWDVNDSISLTADFFQIDLKDRISQTGTININGVAIPAGANCPNTLALPPALQNLGLCLQELGVPGAADLSSVSFYTNDFKTKTTGFDLIATYNTDFGDAGNGSLTAAWNWTETEVEDAGSEVSRNRVVDLENFNPKNRGIFTYNHFIGDFRLLARASYYGEWVSSDYSGDPTPRGPNGAGYTIDCAGPAYNDQCVDGEWIFDLEAAYSFNENWTAVIGAQNVADNFGPVDEDNLDGTIGSGNTYNTGTPWGFDGGFWYLRLRADFD